MPVTGRDLVAVDGAVNRRRAPLEYVALPPRAFLLGKRVQRAKYPEVCAGDQATRGIYGALSFESS